MSSSDLVEANELARFVEQVVVAVGAREKDAASVARVLVDADLRGIDTHGVARLPAYVRLVDRGLLDLAAVPVVDTRGLAVALIDAANGFGQPAGELAIDVVCELASKSGIGWVNVRHSNHFGIVGYYTRMAAETGLIAFAGTNSAAVVAPTRATQQFLGTNPLAFAAPGRHGCALSLDMSTSAVAGGKLEQAIREERPIPRGWVLTADGQDTNDPRKGITAGGALLPLGGSELHSSYKGYGLALMVEVLSSTLAGGPYGRGVEPLTSAEPRGAAEIGHFFMALDPQRFGEMAEFVDRMETMCTELRDLPPANLNLPVLVPGDPEKRALRERRAGGIPLHHSVLAALDDLAARFGASPPRRSGSSGSKEQTP